MNSSSLECPKSMQVPLPGFLQIFYHYPHPQICQRLVIRVTLLVRVYRDQRSGLLKALKQRSLRLSHLDSVQVATTTGLVVHFSYLPVEIARKSGGRKWPKNPALPWSGKWDQVSKLFHLQPQQSPLLIFVDASL